MAEAYPESVPARYSRSVSIAPALWRYLALLLIVVAAVVAIDRPKPPDAAPLTAPATEFSSARAMVHVENVARSPHPIGAAEHVAVKDYIVQQLSAIGLTPEIQETSAVDEKGEAPFTAGTVRNIVAAKKGTGASPAALMLVAHYDSVPTSAGASDNGVAVASLLETARALSVGPQLKNDVIFLFTDGEETGLLGAKAFVSEHPRAKDVRLVLNFEARGVNGPVALFETSDGNQQLISEFAKAASHPVASSLFGELYKLLPNNTDLSVFKAAGLPGLNFAFFKGLTHYHTQLDSLDNVNQPSLQHQGSYALALAQQFGNADLSKRSDRNAVYFDLLGIWLVHYSTAWVIPLIALTALLYAGVTIAGFVKGRLTLTGVALGFLFLLLAMLIAPLVVGVAWVVISTIHPDYRAMLQGHTYDTGVYLIAFFFLTMGITTALYALFRKKATIENLLVGSLLWWVLLLLLAAPALPGISYLLTWPLLFMLAGLAVMLNFRKTDLHSAGNLLFLSLSAIPGVLIIVPVVHTALLALPVGAAGPVMVLVVLLFALLLPVIGLAARRGRVIPAVAFGLALVLISVALVRSSFDTQRPKPTNLFYALNADTGKSLWVSSDGRANEWTSQFLTSPTETGKLADFFPLSSRSYTRSAAPSIEVLPPDVSVLDDRSENGVRSLSLRLRSVRQAPYMSIQLDSETKILGAAVNGKQISTATERWGLRYFGAPSNGIDLLLRIAPGAPLKLRVVDQTYELPNVLVGPARTRPDYMMAPPFPYSLYSDSTLVSKSFSF
jgi:hypothetical protein